MRALIPRSLTANLGTGGSLSALPTRVRRLVEAQELRSERLIGWTQLAIVLIFATLYAVAPKPTDAIAAMFQPVPMALGAYLVFTLVRLGLSYVGYLPGWLLVLSMLVDVGLLLGLIWSFHLQYQQPAAFYLKIPTFIYIFVFISLRALRFDPRFVLSVGLFAAVGWAGMVAYALWDGGPQAMTRNFVDYLTGNYILLGAEIDKLSTLLVVTFLLTFALWRGRRTLLLAVRQETAARDMRRFLSRGVAEAITDSEDTVDAGMAERREAAIMMLDIRGFTRFSATVPPEDVVAMLTSLHERVLPLIQGHNGVVDKFLGDGVMATFGAVQASPTAAADAVRALVAAMAEAQAWTASMVQAGVAAPLTVNGAVAAGPIVFATLGFADRLEYTVIGEAANLAAKLEKHNKAEGVSALTAKATYDAAVAQGYVPATPHEHRPGRTVAGVAAPLDLVVLTA